MQARPINVFYGHIAAALMLSLLGMWGATQYVAYALGYQPQLGAPLYIVHGYPLYAPWQWWLWAYHFEPYAPWVFERASWITYGACFTMFAVLLYLASVRAKRSRTSHAYGSARWAEEKELDDFGLFTDAGVVLCQTADATFHSEKAKDKETGEDKLNWVMDRPGDKLIRHNGAEHVLCFAPTRSWKGVGLVIPSMLTWVGSTVVYDIKKELWHYTAGWRRQFSHTLCFEPTSRDSVKFNPLLEVRLGDMEVADAQNIAEILCDPEGKGEKKDHWQDTGFELVVAAILHVLYVEPDKSLPGVASFLSQPGKEIWEILEYMRDYPHLGDRPHKVIAELAQNCLNKSDNELSGVVSTAQTWFKLYRDPVVAAAVSGPSDFRIADLMNAERPVSLYLVARPSDRERLKPLTRLMLNQIGSRLTESMDFDKRSYRHRLLMMIDEFPTLGYMGFIESQQAYAAGYGIKMFLIAQSLNQIEKIYGPKNSILDNCAVRVTYGANDDHTAERISKLLGETTEKRRQLNFAGSRLAPWLGHVMESEQENARKLLTPGEVLQLPITDALVFVSGLPPYRGKKVAYYQDARLKVRAGLPRPETPAERRQELLPKRASEWLSRASASVPAPVVLQPVAVAESTVPSPELASQPNALPEVVPVQPASMAAPDPFADFGTDPTPAEPQNAPPAAAEAVAEVVSADAPVDFGDAWASMFGGDEAAPVSHAKQTAGGGTLGLQSDAGNQQEQKAFVKMVGVAEDEEAEKADVAEASARSERVERERADDDGRQQELHKRRQQQRQHEQRMRVAYEEWPGSGKNAGSKDGSKDKSRRARTAEGFDRGIPL